MKLKGVQKDVLFTYINAKISRPESQPSTELC